MKKNYVFLAFVLTVCGCAKDPVMPKNPAPPKANIEEQTSKIEAQLQLALLKEQQTEKTNIKQIEWLGPINSSLFKAQKEQKCLMFYFYMENCPYCQILEQTSFESNDVVNIIDEGFVPIKINIEESNFSAVFNIAATPTLIFLASDGHLLSRIDGAVSNGFLIENLNLIKQECQNPKETQHLQEPF